MRRRLWGLMSISTVALFAACGGSSDDGLTDDKGTPIDDVPELYAEATCTAVEACFGPAFETFNSGEDCRADAEIAVEDDLQRLKDAIDDGRVKYDGTKVKPCIDKLKGLSCAALNGQQPEECEDVVDGTVENGGDCSMDAECQSEQAYCKAGNSCPGKCTPREAAGGACKRNSDCAVGLECSEDTDRCFKPAEEGQACRGTSEPDCGPGLFCIGADDDTGASGTCQDINEVLSAKEGDACSFDKGPFCGAGLHCVIDGIDETKGELITTCRKTVGAGEACKLGFPDQCNDNEYCAAPPESFEGTCTPKPKDGEPCATSPADPESEICAPNTRCDGGTCRSRQKLGGSCQTDDVCYSENCVKGGCAPGGACE